MARQNKSTYLFYDLPDSGWSKSEKCSVIGTLKKKVVMYTPVLEYLRCQGSGRKSVYHQLQEGSSCKWKLMDDGYVALTLSLTFWYTDILTLTYDVHANTLTHNNSRERERESETDTLILNFTHAQRERRKRERHTHALTLHSTHTHTYIHTQNERERDTHTHTHTYSQYHTHTHTHRERMRQWERDTHTHLLSIPQTHLHAHAHIRTLCGEWAHILLWVKELFVARSNSPTRCFPLELTIFWTIDYNIPFLPIETD